MNLFQKSFDFSEGGVGVWRRRGVAAGFDMDNTKLTTITKMTMLINNQIDGKKTLPINCQNEVTNPSVGVA